MESLMIILNTLIAVVGFAVAILLTLLFGEMILPVLVRKKVGQYISEYVGMDHQKKAGTPTMGGICFVPAFLVAVAVVMIYWRVLDYQNIRYMPLALVVLYAIGNAAIGFVDDWFKLNKRQNEGLTDLQKLLLQMVLAGGFIVMMRITGNLSTALNLPFCDLSIDLSFFAYPIYLLVLVGFVNATNITDGLDGLASSVCATVAVFIALFAVLSNQPDIALPGGALLGCVLGFLAYNHHPAKMFMGDTGSLFLGAVIMGCAVMAGELILFVLAGFMFVIEMLSSFIQRFYFKVTARIGGTGKRLFRMAPLHHHFERLDRPWREVKIVLVFTLVSLGFCVLAYFGI